MKFIYVANIFKDENEYWGKFIDLDGCYSQGDSLEEIISNLEESMEGYLLSLIDRNIPLPKPSNISDISVDAGFTTLISVDFNPSKLSKSVKKTLTIPYWLNKRATDMNINFSQILQEELLKIISL